MVLVAVFAVFVAELVARLLDLQERRTCCLSFELKLPSKKVNEKRKEMYLFAKILYLLILNI